MDFVEHTVCRARSYSSVPDAQRLSVTRHGWGALDEVDRRIQGRRFDTLCHTFAETAPTFLLSRTVIPNNSLALIAFSQGAMFASAHPLIGRVFRKVLNFHVWNGSPQGASARSPCSCQIDDVSSLQNCVFTNNREMQHIQWDAAHAETTRWLESVCQCWHHRGHSQTPLPTSLLCGVETCDCEVPKCLLYNLLCPQCPFFNN